MSSDYAYYLELNRKYEATRLQVLRDMESNQEYGQVEARPAEDVIPAINVGPSILETETIPAEGCVAEDNEELRDVFYKLFVEKQEPTKQLETIKEEAKQVNPERVRPRQIKRGRSKKRRKTGARKERILSHKELGNELAKKLEQIKARLSHIQNEAHNKLLYAEDTFSIKNMGLLEKVFPAFLEMIAVRWEEIADLLIDDLLYDTVRELNVIDAVKNEKWVAEKPVEKKIVKSLNVDPIEVLNEYLECEQKLNAKYSFK
eukprot:TRINITY_DN17784_c0_g2_i1.p1 TRINITY_DN17784_c0_g2~~TRINITY_DN17784_c0_g2_i1.p1  ORF type:complete len:260 (+),score=66.14 TRINITY_DN17784_c0_g2_i1:98-877(+)